MARVCREACGRLPANSGPYGKVQLEASLPNRRGTVTMARFEDPDSGNGEFFINLRDSAHLDAREGYAP